MAFEHARQIGTREPFEPGMTLAAAALTTDGSESLAMDTNGITIPSQGVAITQPGTEAVMASGTS